MGGACKIFYVCKTRGVIQYFHVFPGGHTTFFLCFKGGIQHFYSTKDPATFSLSKRCTTFCMCQRLRCLLRPTLVPDHNIVSTLTVTLRIKGTAMTRDRYGVVVINWSGTKVTRKFDRCTVHASSCCSP